MPQQLPLYQCHKRVRAAKITAIDRGVSDGLVIGTWLLTLEGQPGRTEVAHSWLEKHAPMVGGYYVVYGDSYASYSPAKAFEEGYDLVADDLAGEPA